MINGGCAESKPFLQGEIGPPSNSYGCCTQVGLPGSADKIGSLPGNKASADCDYYIDNEITVTVPIWDTAGGNGVERLVPHRRLRRIPDHRLLRWQEHRGRLAKGLLHRARKLHADNDRRAAELGDSARSVAPIDRRDLGTRRQSTARPSSCPDCCRPVAGIRPIPCLAPISRPYRPLGHRVRLPRGRRLTAHGHPQGLRWPTMP